MRWETPGWLQGTHQCAVGSAGKAQGEKGVVKSCSSLICVFLRNALLFHCAPNNTCKSLQALPLLLAAHHDCRSPTFLTLCSFKCSQIQHVCHCRLYPSSWLHTMIAAALHFSLCVPTQLHKHTVLSLQALPLLLAAHHDCRNPADLALVTCAH